MKSTGAVCADSCRSAGSRGWKTALRRASAAPRPGFVAFAHDFSLGPVRSGRFARAIDLIGQHQAAAQTKKAQQVEHENKLNGPAQARAEDLRKHPTGKGKANDQSGHARLVGQPARLIGDAWPGAFAHSCAKGAGCISSGQALRLADQIKALGKRFEPGLPCVEAVYRSVIQSRDLCDLRDAEITERCG